MGCAGGALKRRGDWEQGDRLDEGGREMEMLGRYGDEAMKMALGGGLLLLVACVAGIQRRQRMGSGQGPDGLTLGVSGVAEREVADA